MYKDDIQEVVEKQIRRIYGVDYDVLMLGDYVIDIASHVITTTFKPVPDSKILSNFYIGKKLNNVFPDISFTW